MSVWATISKALGTQPPKPKEGAVYLYCRPSRPFHWVSEEDTGDRPCVKVTGIEIKDASKEFAGKTVNWETVEFPILQAISDGAQFIQLTIEEARKISRAIDQLKPKEDAQ